MTNREDLKARLLARTEAHIAAIESEYREANPDGWWENWAETEKFRRRAGIDRWIGYVPPTFYGADLADLGEDQSGTQVRAYLDGPARNLYLAGPIGTGKSYAAWAVASEAAAMGLRPHVWSTPRLLLDMRPNADSTAFDTACLSDLLVLDDLGAARPTDWATEQIYSIAEHRCNHQLRTIITTNQTYEQLEAIWGAPTMDRFRDRSASLVFKGKSRRTIA